MFSGFSKEQTKLLTDETNKILQSDIATENIDLNIKTNKNYAVVEKAVKEYVSELKNIYVEMVELNTGINPNNIFTAQNMSNKDLSEIDDIIKDYKDKEINMYILGIVFLYIYISNSFNINNDKIMYFNQLITTTLASGIIYLFTYLSDAIVSSYFKDKIIYLFGIINKPG